MRHAGQWKRIVELVNASDGQLVARLTNLLDSFSIVPELRGLPARGHAGLAREARQVQPQLRTMLRYLAGEKRAAREARRIIAEHARHLHYGREKRPVEGGATREVRASEVTVTEDAGWRVVKLTPVSRRLLRKVVLRETQVRAYRDPLDPACELITAALERRGAPPVRHCVCGRFFVRRGRSRRLYCGERCRQRARPKIPRERRRDYAYQQRARTLSAAQLRLRITAIGRWHLSPEKKRRRLRLLRAELQRRYPRKLPHSNRMGYVGATW